MIVSLPEITERNKAIKKLLATWKKNLDIRQKALLVLQLNPLPKIKKIRGYFIP